jgi:hypothetical protein
MRPTSVARALQGLIPPKIATPSSVVSVGVAGGICYGKTDEEREKLIMLPIVLLCSLSTAIIHTLNLNRLSTTRA